MIEENVINTTYKTRVLSTARWKQNYIVFVAFLHIYKIHIKKF